MSHFTCNFLSSFISLKHAISASPAEVAQGKDVIKAPGQMWAAEIQEEVALRHGAEPWPLKNAFQDDEFDMTQKHWKGSYSVTSLLTSSWKRGFHCSLIIQYAQNDPQKVKFHQASTALPSKTFCRLRLVFAGFEVHRKIQKVEAPRETSGRNLAASHENHDSQG